ncbi:hypothetical protein [Actinomadura sp. 9N215]|uniref:hypothetical protein n=1 Tax=Actinomadura sp. 9N215 TaxID=3375150 RepID=UPI0037914C29
MTAFKVRCPVPRCGAENAFESDACAGCGVPLGGYARLSAHASYVFNLGLAAATGGRFAEARDHFAAVAYWRPADVEARNALALADFELGHLDDAARQWTAVQDLKPDDPLARLGLARLTPANQPDQSEPPEPPDEPEPSSNEAAQPDPSDQTERADQAERSERVD